MQLEFTDGGESKSNEKMLQAASEYMSMSVYTERQFDGYSDNGSN